MILSVLLAVGTITVGPKADGTTVRPRPGDALLVRLPGNATTGYRWTVTHRPPALRLVSAKYVPLSPARLGSGGSYVFRFAAGPGSGVLRLVYRRPWQAAKPPLRRFTLTIRTR